MVKQIIPFEEKVKQKFGSMLESAGFKPSEETIERDTKAVAYRSKTNPTNEIVFHVMLQGNYDPNTQEFEFNWLRVQVLNSKNQFNVTLFASTGETENVYAKLGWVYKDEQGLENSLHEIDQIIRNNFQSGSQINSCEFPQGD